MVDDAENLNVSVTSDVKKADKDLNKVASTLEKDVVGALNKAAKSSKNYEQVAVAAARRAEAATGQMGEVTAGAARSIRNNFDIADVALSQYAETATRVLRSLTRTFLDFQNQIVDIIKVVNAFAGQNFASPQVQALANSLSDLGTEIPIAGAGLREIARDLAQLGFFAKSTAASINNDITGAVELVGKTSAALGISAGETGQAFGILRNIFLDTSRSAEEQLTTLGRFSSVINELQNSTAGVSSFLLEFNQRLGATATSIGLTFQEVSGFGAAVAELGQSAQVGATALQGLFIKAQTGATAFAEALGLTQAEFQKEFELKPYETLVRFLEKLSTLTPQYRAELVKQLTDSQRATTTLNGLINNTRILTNATQTANQAFRDGTSINREFSFITEQLSASFSKLGNALAAAVNRGFTALEPVLRPIIDGLVFLVQEFKVLSAILAAGAVGLSLVTVAALGFLILSPKITEATKALSKGWNRATSAVTQYAQALQDQAAFTATASVIGEGVISDEEADRNVAALNKIGEAWSDLEAEIEAAKGGEEALKAFRAELENSASGAQTSATAMDEDTGARLENAAAIEAQNAALRATAVKDTTAAKSGVVLPSAVPLQSEAASAAEMEQIIAVVTAARTKLREAADEAATFAGTSKMGFRQLSEEIGHADAQLRTLSELARTTNLKDDFKLAPFIELEKAAKDAVNLRTELIKVANSVEVVPETVVEAKNLLTSLGTEYGTFLEAFGKDAESAFLNAMTTGKIPDALMSQFQGLPEKLKKQFSRLDFKMVPEAFRRLTPELKSIFLTQAEQYTTALKSGTLAAKDRILDSTLSIAKAELTVAQKTAQAKFAIAQKSVRQLQKELNLPVKIPVKQLAAELDGVKNTIRQAIGGGFTFELEKGLGSVGPALKKAITESVQGTGVTVTKVMNDALEKASFTSENIKVSPFAAQLQISASSIKEQKRRLREQFSSNFTVDIGVAVDSEEVAKNADAIKEIAASYTNATKPLTDAQRQLVALTQKHGIGIIANTKRTAEQEAFIRKQPVAVQQLIAQERQLSFLRTQQNSTIQNTTNSLRSQLAVASQLSANQRTFVKGLSAVGAKAAGVTAGFTALGAAVERSFGGSGAISGSIGGILTGLISITPVLEHVATGFLRLGNVSVAALGKIPLVGGLISTVLTSAFGKVSAAATVTNGKVKTLNASLITALGPAAALVATVAALAAIIGVAVVTTVGLIKWSRGVADAMESADKATSDFNKGLITANEAAAKLDEQLQRGAGEADGYFAGVGLWLRQMTGVQDALQAQRDLIMDNEIASMRYVRRLKAGVNEYKDVLEDVANGTIVPEEDDDYGDFELMVNSIKVKVEDFDAFSRALGEAFKDGGGQKRFLEGIIQPINDALAEGADVEPFVEKMIAQLNKIGVSAEQLPNVVEILLEGQGVDADILAKIRKQVEEQAAKLANLSQEELKNRKALLSVEEQLKNILKEQASEREKLATDAVAAYKKATESIIGFEAEKEKRIKATEEAVKAQLESVYKEQLLTYKRLEDLRNRGSITVDEVTGEASTTDEARATLSGQEMENAEALAATYNKLKKSAEDLRETLEAGLFKDTIDQEISPLKLALEEAQKEMDNLRLSSERNREALVAERELRLLMDRQVGNSEEDRLSLISEQIKLIEKRGKVAEEESKERIAAIKAERKEEARRTFVSGASPDQRLAFDAETDILIEKEKQALLDSQLATRFEIEDIKIQSVKTQKELIKSVGEEFGAVRNSLDEEIELVAEFERLLETVEDLNTLSAEGLDVARERNLVEQELARLVGKTAEARIAADQKIRELEEAEENKKRKEQLDVIDEAERRLLEAEQQVGRERPGLVRLDAKRQVEIAQLEGLEQARLLKLEQEKEAAIKKTIQAREEAKEAALAEGGADAGDRVKAADEAAKAEVRAIAEREVAERALIEQRALREKTLLENRGRLTIEQARELQNELDKITQEAQQEIRRIQEGVNDDALMGEQEEQVNAEAEAANEVTRAREAQQAVLETLANQQGVLFQSVNNQLAAEQEINKTLANRIAMLATLSQGQGQAEVGGVPENQDTARVVEDVQSTVVVESESFVDTIGSITNTIIGTVTNFAARVTTFANGLDSSLSTLSNATDSIVSSIQGIGDRLSTIESKFQSIN